MDKFVNLLSRNRTFIMGIAILSTSRGIMTDREARLNRIGGEVLCYIW